MRLSSPKPIRHGSSATPNGTTYRQTASTSARNAKVWRQPAISGGIRRRRAGERLLVDAIRGLVHAERRVGALRARVVALDVQAYADRICGRAQAALDLRVQRAEHAGAAERALDVDALQPPPLAVAP